MASASLISSIEKIIKTHPKYQQNKQMKSPDHCVVEGEKGH